MTINEGNDNEKRENENTKFSSILSNLMEFNPNKIKWSTYEARMKQFFRSFDICDEKKKASILLTKLNIESFEMILDTIFPEDLNSVTFEGLTTILNKFYGKIVNIFDERIQFYKLYQFNGETVKEWFSRLKSKIINCKFGKELEFVLKEKFITGLRPGEILYRFFEENENLELEKAFEIAEKKELMISHHYRSINYIKRKKEFENNYGVMFKREGKKVYNLRVENEANPIKICLKINNINLSMEVDTGSSISAMSVKTYRKYFDTIILKPANIFLKGYFGKIMEPLGKFQVNLEYNNMVKMIEIYVVENGGPPILGRNFLKEFNFTLKNNTASNEVPKVYNQSWNQIQMDVCTFKEHNFLILKDSYSKWIEIFKINSLTPKAIISKLYETFARFGLPKSIVSEYGIEFMGEEVELFLKRNGIESNSLPKKGKFKDSNANEINDIKIELNKIINANICNQEEINISLSKYLMHYRNVEHFSTGKKPSEIMFKHKLIMRKDLVKTNINLLLVNLVKKLSVETRKEFSLDDVVYARDYGNLNKKQWQKATVIHKIGRKLYIVELENGRKWKRYLNQLMK